MTDDDKTRVLNPSAPEIAEAMDDCRKAGAKLLHDYLEAHGRVVNGEYINVREVVYDVYALARFALADVMDAAGMPLPGDDPGPQKPLLRVVRNDPPSAS